MRSGRGFRLRGQGRLPAGLLNVPLYWALVDTGADHVYADAAVLREIGASQWGSANVNAEGEASSLHRGFVVFPTINFGTQVAIIARDFRAKGDPYSLAIGRGVLHEFDLHYAGRGGSSKLIKVD